MERNILSFDSFVRYRGEGKKKEMASSLVSIGRDLFKAQELILGRFFGNR